MEYLQWRQLSELRMALVILICYIVCARVGFVDARRHAVSCCEWCQPCGEAVSQSVNEDRQSVRYAVAPSARSYEGLLGFSPHSSVACFEIISSWHSAAPRKTPAAVARRPRKQQQKRQRQESIPEWLSKASSLVFLPLSSTARENQISTKTFDSAAAIAGAAQARMVSAEFHIISQPEMYICFFPKTRCSSAFAIPHVAGSRSPSFWSVSGYPVGRLEDASQDNTPG